MNKISIGLVVCLLLAVSGNTSSSAQETPEPHALIQMMPMVPITILLLDTPPDIFYADLRATEQARPGAPTPANMTEFSEMDQSNLDLWSATAFRQISTAPDWASLYGLDAGMVDYCGFDYFEIDRTLHFERMPFQGSIYGGHFDSEQVMQTLVRRTYTADRPATVFRLCVVRWDVKMVWIGKTGCLILANPVIPLPCAVRGSILFWVGVWANNILLLFHLATC